MASAQNTVSAACESRGCDGIAKHVCKDCKNTKLCDSCKDKHLNSDVEAIRSHTILPLNESSLQKLKFTPQWCKKHNKQYEYYCKTCCLSLCPNCTIDHIKRYSDHQPEELAVVLKDMNREARDALPEVNSKVQAYNLDLENLELSQTRFKDSLRFLRDSVEKRFAECQGSLSASRNKLLKDIDKAEGAEVEKYEKQKKEIKNIIEQANRVQEQIQSNESHSSVEFLEECTKRVNDIRKQPLTTLDIPQLRAFERPSLHQKDVDDLFGRLSLCISNIKTIEAKSTDRESKQSIKTIESKSTDQDSNQIIAIIPINDKMLWIGFKVDTFLTQIKTDGKTVATSVDVGDFVRDGDMTKTGDIMIITQWGHNILRLTQNGQRKQLFKDVSPLCAMSVCMTKTDDVIVAVKQKEKTKDPEAKLCIFDQAGNLLRTIHKNDKGDPMFSWPRSIGILSNGDIAVADSDPEPHRVIRVNMKDQIVHTFNPSDLEKSGGKTTIREIAVDDNDNIYVCSRRRDSVYIMQNTGFSTVLLSKEQNVTEPFGIAFDHGNLYIGCANGIIHLVKVGN